jgi:hypothetical protein
VIASGVPMRILQIPGAMDSMVVGLCSFNVFIRLRISEEHQVRQHAQHRQAAADDEHVAIVMFQILN